MVPIVGVPATLCQGLMKYREIFCREAGCAHVSPNQPLQGMYDLPVWGDAPGPSRCAMHEAIFEAAWSAETLMAPHRSVLAPEHRGRGREGLSLDWASAQQECGPKIEGRQQA